MAETVACVSVGQFLALVNDTLRTIPTETFLVEGEVADFRVSQGKWVNFDLKDEELEAKLPCFMTTYQLTTPLMNGMRVRVSGYPKVFERFGKFSLNVSSVTPVGEGALAKAYALLKQKLTAEGLFEPARKRSLPTLPASIGLITSREAAAYGDFLRVLGNRFGGLAILHAHVHVQGQYAVDEICNAFATFNALPAAERPEVIVLTRGGGSLEELHAFNDERVVRAIFSSAVPVVVGVGHERDETLADFVADVRASTPSNAAERLVPDRRELLAHLKHSEERLADRLTYLAHGYAATVDRALIIIEREFVTVGNQLVAITNRLRQGIDQAVVLAKQKTGTLRRVLESVSPTRVLERGYAIVRSSGRVLRDAAKLAPGDRLQVQFAQGEVAAQVLDKRQKPLWPK